MADLQTPLKTILNFRDVGEYVNRATGSNLLKTGLLYRSARLDEASIGDRKRLIDEYRVRGVIDLRTKTEHIEQAQKRNAKIAASEAVPQSNDDVAGSLKMPELTYHEINFNGSAFSRMLISKLTWGEFFRLAGLMLFGYRLDAIKILAPHMEAMGLIGLAISSLDACTKEVKHIFDVLADDRNWPVLVHCTQGKDRTGLVVMLVLFLLGVVDDAVIDDDYRLSESELAPEKKERMREISSIGLSEQFAVCPPGVIDSVRRHLDERYGGVEQYLGQAGVCKETVDLVRRRLLAGDS